MPSRRIPLAAILGLSLLPILATVVLLVAASPSSNEASAAAAAQELRPAPAADAAFPARPDLSRAMPDDERLFREGYDLLTMGQVTEALKVVLKLRREFPLSPYAAGADVLAGKAYLERYRQKNDRQDLLRARDHLMATLREYASEPLHLEILRHELVSFLVAASEASRALGVANDELEAQVDALLLSADGAAKTELQTAAGYLKFFRGDAALAMRHFQSSNTDWALRGRMLAYNALGDPEAALRVAEEFLDFRSDSAIYERVRGEALKLGMNLGQGYFQDARPTDARRVFHALVKRFPDTREAEEALFTAGLAAVDLRDFSAAHTDFDQVIRQEPRARDDDAIFWKGRAFVEQSRRANAIELFNQLIDYYPDSPYASEARRWLAQLERELADLETRGVQDQSSPIAIRIIPE